MKLWIICEAPATLSVHAIPQKAGMRVEVLEGEEQHSTVVVQNLKYISQYFKENLWLVNLGSIVECDG